MKTKLTFALALTILLITGAPAFAQFTITIPKLPKIKIFEPKTTQPSTTSSEGVQAKPKTDTNKPASEPKNADCSDSYVKHHVGEIKKTQAEAEEFRPGLRSYYVSELNDRRNTYLESALLDSSRKEWFKSDPDSESAKCLKAAFDELAAVARKTLPGYTGPSDYTFGTPAEKKALVLGTFDDIANAKVLKAGMKQANWMIAKDDYNFPTARYKHGVVWAQYPGREFCWIVWVNLKQDYAGGGTYGASYGQYVGRSMAGCPAGK